MKLSKLIFGLSFLVVAVTACQETRDQRRTSDIQYNQVRGWNILSRNDSLAHKVIDRAGEYEINHLQLSHQVIMDLRQAKNPEVAQRVNDLTASAHQHGIEQVYVWDHALYHLDYYPAEFRSGPDSLLNLDNPEFWQWIKQDYRQMLDLLPDIDGIILTFIETGAHVEDQFSAIYQTEEEKLAAMVDTLASVIIDERDLELYVRTFVYNQAELSSMLKCINLVKNPKLKVMTKEAPHDFFLTHPVSEFVGQIKFPTIIEFDAAHEYNGQGIIASMFPEVHMERWNYYKNLPNIIGYVARTDRFNNTTIIDNPAEINLYAIDQVVNQASPPEPDAVFNQFIQHQYGMEHIEQIKNAFQKSAEAVKTSFYTLGLNLNSHSRLQYNDHSGYQRHVSGKWMDQPVINIEHDVNKSFHYWKDIVNHLAPASYKRQNGTQLARESQWVLDSSWLEPVELMDEEYLDYILTEKAYSVRQASEAVYLINQVNLRGEPLYDTLLHVLERTALTTQLYEATAKLFFGYRVLARGGEYNNENVQRTVEQGLQQTFDICQMMKQYPYKGPSGQYDWEEDIYRGLAYYNAVRFRQDDSYQAGFFPHFSFGRMTQEERQAIWEQAMNNQ
ncbi:MAG: hypothetical protein ACNS62_03560 [Candidatus Cyclobacteriaceae bacterium M3_2C_046]